MAGTQRIRFDPERFEPMQICGVQHDLSDHPWLQLDELVKLADRLAPLGRIRYHRGDVQSGTDFVNAPALARVDDPPEVVIRNIETSGAWLALHNVQSDPQYAQLVKEVLDSVKPVVEQKDPEMFHYAGWIFVSSPNAVTPFHMDHEHNFILQIRGRKDIHVFDPLARSVLSEECLEAFHSVNSRDLVQYKPEHEQHATVFNAGPGDGAYMPTTAPHWVQNGPNVSITASFTWLSRETLRREALYRVNARLRKRGLVPSPVGKWQVVDDMKMSGAQVWRIGKRVVQALREPREQFG